MARQFEVWLKFAKPGDQFIYHTGSHLSKKNEGLEYSSKVYSAREAYDRGEVILVQRRVSHGLSRWDPGKFDYIAIKRALVRRPGESVTVEGDLIQWTQRPQLKKAA